MKKIPLLDMKAQLAPIRKDIDKALARVLDSGMFILGDEVKSLQKEICGYSSSRYAIATSNGTDAISLCLESLGIDCGDKVICPAFTYYATAGAITRLGAEPVFVDIDPKIYCIDPLSIVSYLEKTTTKEREKIKAIIAVHLYGQCAQMDEILTIAKKYKLKVIEDTAQGFGALYKGKKAGTMGDASAVSFFPGKNLGACGDAGMILTGNKKIYDKLCLLRNQGADPKNKYKHLYCGHNNRLDDIQAAILRIKLRYLDRWNKKRAQNAAYYNRALKDTGLITPFVPAENLHIYHQYVLRAKNKPARDKILRRLNNKGIDSRVYYPIPLHLQPCFRALKGKIKLIESEKAANETFAIPVYPELNKTKLNYIIDCIKEVL